MCGILGCFGRNSNLIWVEGRLEGLKHRGPDSQIAMRISDQCSFGAARLAMTDPSDKGNQPFSLRGDWLVFNGEIYNYKQIKSELFAGENFSSESDTEVLGRVLQADGLFESTDLNGMYAFAFYEEKNEQLILCRDYSGKKPLYYKVEDETLFFSSDLKQLYTEVKGVYAPALIQVLTLGYTVDPNTILSDIKSVAPGEVNSFKWVDSKLIRTFTINGPKKVNLKNLGPNQDLRNRILNAVERRVDGHQKVALSLSGGIDSTIIAICLKILNKSVTAYSVMWPDADKDRYNEDSTLAKKIAEQNGHNFKTTLAVSATDVPRVLDEYVSIMGEPNCNPTGLSMMSLYEAAKSDGHRLMLTGDGADELFYGYNRYQIAFNVSQFGPLPRLIKLLRLENWGFMKTILASQMNSFDDWSYWHRTFTFDEIERFFNFSKFEINASKIALNSIWEDASSNYENDRVNLMMELDRRIWLTMESNRRLDKVSMAYSIEARSPFQDKDLVESILGANLKTGIKSRLAKRDLLDAFPELSNLELQKQKVGFISPLGNWIRTNWQYVEHNLDLLSKSGFLKNQFNILDKTRAELQAGDFATLRKIWALLVIARWLESVK